VNIAENSLFKHNRRRDGGSSLHGFISKNERFDGLLLCGSNKFISAKKMRSYFLFSEGSSSSVHGA